MPINDKPVSLQLFTASLGTNELQDGYNVLETFFQTYSFDSARLQLWVMVKAALQDCSTYQTAEERNDLLFWYEALLEVLGAAYLLSIEQQTNANNTQQQ